MLLKREMAMPKWKFYLFRTLDKLRTLSFWIAFFEGVVTVLGGIAIAIMFWIAMWLFGEDELHWKNSDNYINHNSSYNESYDLSNEESNFIHNK